MVSTDHCPFCFEDQKMLGKDDFTKIPERRAGHREPAAADLSPRRERRKTVVESVRRTDLDHAGADFRHVSPEGRDRAGQRRRHRDLGSEGAATRSAPQTHHMRVDYSMFEGFEVKGNARTVLSRGEVIVDRRRNCLGKPGRGALSEASRRAVAHGSDAHARSHSVQRRSGARSAGTAHLGHSTTTRRCGSR